MRGLRGQGMSSACLAVPLKQEPCPQGTRHPCTLHAIEWLCSVRMHVYRRAHTPAGSVESACIQAPRCSGVGRRSALAGLSAGGLRQLAFAQTAGCRCAGLASPPARWPGCAKQSVIERAAPRVRRRTRPANRESTVTSENCLGSDRLRVQTDGVWAPAAAGLSKFGKPKQLTP